MQASQNPVPHTERNDVIVRFGRIKNCRMPEGGMTCTVDVRKLLVVFICFYSLPSLFRSDNEVSMMASKSALNE